MNETTVTNIKKIHGACKKYLRANGVAEYAGIGLSTVWYYVKIGKLRARVTVFIISEIVDLINNSINVG